MAELAVVALVAGEAAVTAATVLTAVAEVGAAMSIVGAVTGNKDLIKIGGTMALVGGVGSMAAGAMSGAAADAAATTVLDEAASQVGADALTASLDQGANAMATGVTDSATAQVGSDALAQQLDQQAMGQVASNTASAPVAANQMPMDNSAVATAADAGIVNPMSNGVSNPYDNSTAAAWSDPSAGKDTLASVGANGYPGSQKVNSDNWFASMFKNAKPDTLLNLGGNVLGGVAKGYEADRNYQLGKDRVGSYDRRVGLIQQQMAYGNSAPRYNFKA